MSDMKKGDFDIEQFIRKRQLNVQEQISSKKHRIRSRAQYWRAHDLPVPLIRLFEAKNIDITTSIIIEYDQDFPGGSTDEGIILTQEGRFFEFWADLNQERTQLVALEYWEEVTKRYEIKDHQKGIGKTFGLLALEVLKELNTPVDEA